MARSVGAGPEATPRGARDRLAVDQQAGEGGVGQVQIAAIQARMAGHQRPEIELDRGAVVAPGGATRGAESRRQATAIRRERDR